MSLLNAKRPVWEPFNVEDTNVFKFIQFINEKHRLQLQTYGDLHAWSVAAEMFQTFWEDAFLWFRLSPPGLKDHPGPMLEGTVLYTLTRRPRITRMTPLTTNRSHRMSLSLHYSPLHDSSPTPL